MLDRSASLTIGSIRWVHVDRRIIPRLLKAVCVWKLVLDFRVYNGRVIGTWIQINAASKYLLHGFHVLARSPPILTKRIDLSSRSHSPRILLQSFLASLPSVPRSDFSELPTGVITLNQSSSRSWCVSK